MKEAREMNKGTTHRSFNSAARTGAGFVSFFFLQFKPRTSFVFKLEERERPIIKGVCCWW